MKHRLLTGREKDVVKLVIKGQSNKQIAKGLAISPETVKTHMTHIFVKLEASNRAQAAAKALHLQHLFG